MFFQPPDNGEEVTFKVSAELNSENLLEWNGLPKELKKKMDKKFSMHD